MLTQQELDEIRARCERATPEPWAMCDAEFSHCNASSCIHGNGANCELCEKCKHAAFYHPAFLYGTDTIDNGEYDGLLTVDARFCMHARADVPALLGHIAEQNEEIKALSEKNDILAAAFDRVFTRRNDLEAENKKLRAHADPLKRACEILSQQINGLAIEPRWIPCSEKMPKIDERVLFWKNGEGGGLRSGCGTGSLHRFQEDPSQGFALFEGHVIYHTHCLTHWMPLPEPPKED